MNLQAIKSTFTILMLLSVFACSEAPPPPSSEAVSNTQPEVSNQATYTVITENDFAPFEFRGNDGSFTGFDIDILNAIAQKENIHFNFVGMKYNNLWPSIQNDHNYDILAAAITINDERRAIVDFSQPYFESKQTAILNKKIPQIKSFEDLKTLRVATKAGNTSEEILKKIVGDEGKLIYVDTGFLALRAVLNNEADAHLGDSGVLLNYAKEHADAGLHTFIDPAYPSEFYGFVVRKNREDDLLQKLNHGLDTIKKDGTYQTIFNKWFGD